MKAKGFSKILVIFLVLAVILSGCKIEKVSSALPIQESQRPMFETMDYDTSVFQSLDYCQDKDYFRNIGVDYYFTDSYVADENGVVKATVYVIPHLEVGEYRVSIIPQEYPNYPSSVTKMVNNNITVVTGKERDTVISQAMKKLGDITGFKITFTADDRNGYTATDFVCTPLSQ
jgi:hypothetical protein